MTNLNAHNSGTRSRVTDFFHQRNNNNINGFNSTNESGKEYFQMQYQAQNQFNQGADQKQSASNGPEDSNFNGGSLKNISGNEASSAIPEQKEVQKKQQI